MGTILSGRPLGGTNKQRKLVLTPVINNRLAWWILRQVWRKFSKVKITMSVPVVLLLLGGISAAQTSIPTGSAPRIVLEVSAVSFDITWQQKYLSVDRALLDYVGARRPWTRNNCNTWDRIAARGIRR
jgi:hypothetical protein